MLTERSETLTWDHLSKLTFIILFFLLGPSLFAQTKKNDEWSLVKSDEAVVRIPGHVFFLSDINKRLKALEKFSCIRKSSLLLKVIDTEKSLFPKKELTNAEELRPYKASLQKVLILEKLKTFIATVSRPSKEGRIWKALRSHCKIAPYKEWSSEFKEAVGLEVFLEERFWASRLKSDLPKAHESVQRFVRGLAEKTSHSWLIEL